MFDYTQAIDKLRRLTKPTRVVQGGTWAGKTESILAILIDKAADESSDPIDCTVVAQTIPAIKMGALKIFKDIMVQTGRWIDDNFNATDRVYSFASGSAIKFSAFDSPEKAKPEKRTHLFINECDHVLFPIAQELMQRTSEETWLDFNPNNSFWVHEEILGDDDVDHIILTYEDNEFTPDTILKKFEKAIAKGFIDPEASWEDDSNIKNHYWANWCRVYIRGLLGKLEGLVFDEYEAWEIIDVVPPEARLKGYGMDFGYTNDPSTWIGGYEWNGTFVFDELIYRAGLKSGDMASMMKGMNDVRVRTWADAAEPRPIDELFAHGINIKGARKGKDSINFGIDLLQQEKFYVTARSVNTIAELRAYAWQRDKAGKITNSPIDAFNHCIDAMRYFAIENISKAAHHTPMLPGVVGF